MHNSSAETAIIWTPEGVARFWNYWADHPELHEQYFTAQVGEAVARFLSFATELRGARILDYGCGLGFLADKLLNHGAVVTAVDFSERSVAHVNATLDKRASWEGAFVGKGETLPFPAGGFDAITCIEVIEHLFDHDRITMLDEFRRLLRPGGIVMISTPNDEDLRKSMVVCPDCGTTFHAMQHMRSWSTENLSETLRQVHFEILFCGGLDISTFSPRARRHPFDYSVRSIKDGLFDAVRRLSDRVHHRDFPHGREFQRLLLSGNRPHLVAIARRT
jgi:2-polyprenyl-3-methyl-5-hydroxy-6-metoxy-1,4-benzoquinol methylase